jgi:tetratricopeptide (TPR) repeat protein
VQGRIGNAGTPQYRDALLELAAVESRRGDYAGAIQNLEEAVARYPEDPQIATIQYSLADAYRQDSRAIRKSLGEALPDSRKQALTETRVTRLKKAQEIFDLAGKALESRDPRRLTALERLQMRNAAFFAADCSFDLGDYEQAIRRYDAAREKYPQDPASLVAMVQIVNAYIELGDTARATTANERAKLFHKSLPAEVWNDPSLPIGNEEWARWLGSMDKLKAPPAPGAPGSPVGTATASEKDQ